MRAAVRTGALSVGLALVAVLGFGGCSGGDASTQRYELSGKVVDALSGEGVGDVEVTFTSDTLFTESTRTGSGGGYEMAIRTDAELGQVRAEKEGWLPDERTVFFDTPSRRIDLEIRERSADD